MPPKVNLKPTVIPRSIARVTILGDLMANFGLPDEIIQTAQQGLAEGIMSGISVIGYGFDNYVEDEVHLNFDELKSDEDINVDTSGGKSMIEAFSVRFAHAVSYSIDTMRRKGLRINYRFFFYPGCGTPENFARFGLTPSADNTQSAYRPGYGPRRILSVRPGLDKGISYSHATSWRLK